MIKPPLDNIYLRRGIFVFGHFAAFTAFFFLFAWPVHRFYTDRDLQIDEQRAALVRLHAIASARSTVDELIAHAKSDESRIAFLEAANDGVAAANLQTLLKTMAQSAGANLRSVRTLAAEVSDDTKFIGAQVEITGPIEAVYRAVHAVEMGKPLLFIRNALLKPSQQTAVSPAGGAAVPTIDARLDVLAPLQLVEASK